MVGVQDPPFLKTTEDDVFSRGADCLRSAQSLSNTTGQPEHEHRPDPLSAFCPPTRVRRVHVGWHMTMANPGFHPWLLGET